LRRIGVALAALVAPIVLIVLALDQGQSPAQDDPGLRASNVAAHTAKHKKRRRVDHSGHYLALARKGIYDSYANWWNPGKTWFNDRLNDNDQYPLGTIWTLFPLWEALSGVAIAEPTSSHRNEVDWFGNVARSYYNSLVGCYGPYPGRHTR